jgi:hypothetical protein
LEALATLIAGEDVFLGTLTLICVLPGRIEIETVDFCDSFDEAE